MKKILLLLITVFSQCINAMEMVDTPSCSPASAIQVLMSQVTQLANARAIEAGFYPNPTEYYIQFFKDVAPTALSAEVAGKMVAYCLALKRPAKRLDEFVFPDPQPATNFASGEIQLMLPPEVSLGHQEQSESMDDLEPVAEVSQTVFQCPLCNKKFTEDTHRTRHILTIHSPGKPKYCDIPNCGYFCKREDCMKRHKTVVHGDPDSDAKISCTLPGCGFYCLSSWGLGRHKSTQHPELKQRRQYKRQPAYQLV